MKRFAVIALLLLPCGAGAGDPSPSPTSGFLNGAAGALAAVGSGTGRLLRLLARSTRRPAPGEPPTYLVADLSFRDVRILGLSERLGLSLPFHIDGRLSVALHVAMPVNTPLDLKAYRLHGTLDLPALHVGGLAVEAVKGRLDYRDGALLLEEITGRLPGAGPPGTFSGTARLRVSPPGDLSARARVEGFDLSTLGRLPPQVRPPVRLGGKARLDVTAEVPLRRGSAEVRGTVRVSDTAVEKLRVGTVEARFSLQPGVLTVELHRARVSGGDVAGSASLPLRRTERGVIDLKLKEVEVAAAVKALADTSLPLKGRLSGTVKAILTASKADQPRSLRAVVDVTGPDLRIRNVPAQRLSGEVRYRDRVVEYDLQADAFGGKVRLDGRLPPKRRGAPVRLRGLVGKHPMLGRTPGEPGVRPSTLPAERGNPGWGDAKSGMTKAEAAAFADRAVAAVNAGWGLLDERKGPDFDPLRGRADFQKLLAEEWPAAGRRIARRPPRSGGLLFPLTR